MTNEIELLCFAPEITVIFITNNRFFLGKKCAEIHYLLGERPARSLGMSPQHAGLHIFWFEIFLNLTSPQSTGSSHLCYFHVKIHSNSPEEGQTGCETVNVQSSFES